MKNATETIKLIDGCYPAEDALHILEQLIHNKINFHELNVFSCEERGIQDNLNSKERIAELEQERDKIRHLKEQYSGSDIKITLKSDVTVLLPEMELV